MTNLMTAGTDPLSIVLERDHRVIDGGLEFFGEAATGQPYDRDAISRAIDGLRRHIYLEEELLFPALREAGLMAPVFVMLREHSFMWPVMDELDDLVAREADDASLRDPGQRLWALLQGHNPREEMVLYPQADVVLDSVADGVVRAFLANGTIPIGWKCQFQPASDGGSGALATGQA